MRRMKDEGAEFVFDMTASFSNDLLGLIPAKML